MNTPPTPTIAQAFAASMVQLAVALALLGLFLGGTYTGHISVSLTMGLIGTLIGLVGVVSVAVLNSTVPNIMLVPHLLFTLAVVASVAILLFHNDITDVALASALGPILGGAIAISGGNSTSTVIQALVPSTSPASIPDKAATGSTIPTQGEPVGFQGTPAVAPPIPAEFGTPPLT